MSGQATSSKGSKSSKSSKSTKFSRFMPRGGSARRDSDIMLDDIPILEDEDEGKTYSQPVLPSFQASDTVSNRSGNSARDTANEFERDFDEEFTRDTENQKSGGGHGREKLAQANAKDADSSDEESTDSDDSSDGDNRGAAVADDDAGTNSEGDESVKVERPGFLERIKTTMSVKRVGDTNDTTDAEEGTQNTASEDVEDVSSSGITHTNFLRNIFRYRPTAAGGMTPGAASAQAKVRRKPTDKEAVQQNGDNSDKDDNASFEAQELVNELFEDGSTNNAAYTNPELLDADDAFDDLANNYSEFDIDVPESLAGKPRKVRRGIASSLLSLYNHGNSSQQNTPNSKAYVDDVGASELDGSDFDANMQRRINTPPPHDRRSTSSLMRQKIGQFKIGHMSSPNLSHVHSTPEEVMSQGTAGTAGTSATHQSEHGNDAGPQFQMPKFNKTEGSEEVNAGYEDVKKRRKNMKTRMHKKQAARITVHIADVLKRQQFIMTLCKAFMRYGAPTHRLEEYMTMTARVLEIDGSFVYFPGCMLISFGDSSTRTTETRLVRCPEGVDLGRLTEVHDIYKEVVHDQAGVEESTNKLDAIMARKPRYTPLFCITMYAFCSGVVGPWGFGASWIDIPICVAVGIVIGTIQFVICPISPLYSSLFEVTASIISSFIARAIGSVRGGNLFCYSSIVQSALALILPGYIILCGSLEMQSRNIVAGSVRMFYAFIYSLMLSFGITLGAALYGWFDSNAVSAEKCTSNISPWYYFFFVPAFTSGIALCNQATWDQLPAMSLISGSGYVVAYFSGKHFKNATEITATLGCFVVGLVANLYSRFMKSTSKYLSWSAPMTASLMLPAIFVQVPSGIASQGSVLLGTESADELVHTNSSATTNSVTSVTSSSLGSLSFGMLMIQVALGISVGLYIATIIVYPVGKSRTGLFTL